MIVARLVHPVATASRTAGAVEPVLNQNPNPNVQHARTEKNRTHFQIKLQQTVLFRHLLETLHQLQPPHLRVDHQ